MHARAHSQGAGDAIRYAKARGYSPRTLEMLEKAAVSVGSMTGPWGSELAPVEPASRGFLALLPPYTAFDRLAADKAFTPLPLHTRLGRASSAAIASYVGENVMKPVTRFTVSAEVMPVQKVFATATYTDWLELAEGSLVSDLFQSMLRNAVAKKTDEIFLQTISEGTGVISNPSTGTDATEIIADIGLAMQSINAGIGIGSRLYFIASPSVMANVGFKLAVGGTAPNLGVLGGTFAGINFIRSDAAGSDAIVLDATAVGADPGVALGDRSRDTSLILDDNPSGYHTVSLFQNNLIAEGVERFFGVCVLKPEGIAVITGMGSTA